MHQTAIEMPRDFHPALVAFFSLGHHRARRVRSHDGVGKSVTARIGADIAVDAGEASVAVKSAHVGTKAV